jgi:hypothetical protein
MSNIIGLTKTSDDAWVLVNTDHIVFFYESGIGTFVSFSNGSGFDVVESMTDIQDRIDCDSEV